MKPQTAQRWLFVAVRAFGASFAVTVFCLYGLAGNGGCTQVKGSDTEKTTNFSKFAETASTRASESSRGDRQAATRQSGGEVRTADYTSKVAVSPSGVYVEVVDHNAATTAPTIISTSRERTASAAETQAKSDTRSTTQSSADVTKAPTYSGGNANVNVDGDRLSSEAIRSKFWDRWPVMAIFGVIGAIYWFLPPPKGSQLTGAACFGAAVASLILSDFWLLVICAVPVVVVLYPKLKTSTLYTRLVAQMDDWKSDIPVGSPEREAFDGTLAIAARGNEKFVDRVRVAAKHAKAAVPVPAVPEVTT